MSTVKTPQTKMYVLLPHTKPTAAVYQRISKTQRVRVDKRKQEAAQLQFTITDRDGVNKTLRYKANCPSIYLQEQMEKYKIPANEKFTDRERSIRYFYNEVLVTNNETFQKFLEASPEFDGFWKEKDGMPPGQCDEIKRPLYTLYDPTVQIKSQHEATKLRIRAGQMVMDIDNIEDAGVLLKRLYGGQHKVPDLLEQCQNQLIDYIDGASDKELQDMTRTSLTADEEMDILIGRALDLGILDFNEEPGKIMMKKKGQSIAVKEIPVQYPFDERTRYLGEFLLSDAGKLLQDELKALVESKSQTGKKDKAKDDAKTKA